jgi:Rad3-related DNA helicase
MPVIYTPFGIHVDFPCEPYDVQVAFINATLDALSSGRHALLESPTGTGKTLCLLTACLAYQQHAKATGGGQHVIFYASRTHAQLTQVIREFKKTSYSRLPGVTMSVLGSREHLCVHPEVTRLKASSAQTARCSSMKASHACRFFNGLDAYMAGEERDASLGLSETPKGLCDIEELVGRGRKSNFCPYFYERAMAEGADIVFLPYSYLIDPTVSKQLNVSTGRAVLVFDDAHNLSAYVSTALSFDINVADLFAAMREVTAAIEMVGFGERGNIGLDSVECERLSGDFSALEALLGRWAKQVLTERLSDGSPRYATYPGDTVFSFFERLNISHGSAGLLQSALSDCVRVLQTDGHEQYCDGLQKVADVIRKLYGSSLPQPTLCNDFLFVVVEQGADDRAMGLWCMEPSMFLQTIAANARGCILADRCLTPMNTFAAELGFLSPILFQGSPARRSGNLKALVPWLPAPTTPGQRRLQRSVDAVGVLTGTYYVDLGEALCELLRCCPRHALLLLPSSVEVGHAMAVWSRRGLVARLDAHKAVLFDHTGDGEAWQAVVDECTGVAPLASASQTTQQRHDGMFLVAAAPPSEAVLTALRGAISCVFVAGPLQTEHAAGGSALREYLQMQRFNRTANRPRDRLRHRSCATLQERMTGEEWNADGGFRAMNRVLEAVVPHAPSLPVAVLYLEPAVHHVPSVVLPFLRPDPTAPDVPYHKLYASLAQWFTPWHSATVGGVANARGLGQGRAIDAATSAPQREGSVSAAQPLQEPPASQPTPPPVENMPSALSSQEPLARVKAAVPPAAYAEFKTLLVDLMNIQPREDGHSTRQSFREWFSTVVAWSNEHSCSELLGTDIVRCVPEGCQAFFHHLLKKRQR